MSRSRSCSRFHRSHATRLLALGLAITLVPTAAGAPADIAEIAAPVIGADPPKAQDIPDGDVSVATQTGSLSYSYPIKVPPGRGMEPSLSLSYSSQAPIYGGPAAGWQLSIPMIQWDTSKGRMRYAHYADLAQSPEWDDEPFVSSLSGGRPLVRVTGDPDGQNFRAKNDSSWIRYERHQQLNDPEGNGPRWIARTPEGVTHYFGEGAFITNLSTVETVDLTRVRAPLTRSVDQFGNTVEYNWDFEDGELRIALIRYTVNEASDVDPFAEVSFVYGSNPSCAGIPVGSQTDYRTNVPFVDGASRLVQIVAKALDPATSSVEHTRQIDLV
jgi:Salmonella virulence plasmid 65kDa B protein